MKFVSGAEAAVVEDSLIIADLHLGMERELFRRGIRIGDFTDYLIDRTLLLLRETKCRDLIVLGDIKENVVSLEGEVRRYFNSVLQHASVTVCKGNHDGNIERISGIKTVGPEGFVLHGVGMFHGHAWPAPELMRCKTILMGHNHPQLTFFEGGKKGPRPVWVFCPPLKSAIRKKYPSLRKYPQLVLMPSFNQLLGNDIERFGGLGPIFRNKLFKMSRAIVYTLHGTRLGTVEEVTKR
ncbi:MAG: metallophosphoesterase [Candidatus ainarchaeum sp.]|nr:metallophosphoesterase [Candidatus ainarchaeum sp.]MDD5096205.1 metallophosphoesterase [Candidatus ainarchaeum sp.]